MFVTLKMVLGTLLVPPAGPLLLAAAGLWLLARRRNGHGASRAGLVLASASVVALWLLSTPVIADGLTRLTEHYPALDPDRPVRGQAIVILGGATERTAPEYGGPAAGFELLERVSYGAYLARRTGLPVLVSGTAREAAAMRATLARDFGITARWADGESRDTFDNARFSARPGGDLRNLRHSEFCRKPRGVDRRQRLGLAERPRHHHQQRARKRRSGAVELESGKIADREHKVGEREDRERHGEA